MKKVKVGISFYFLIILCLLTKQIGLLINYFFALILHELAHLFVATSKGYKLRQMYLSMCGLFINLEENIDDKDAFLINIAGPSFNLFLSVCCLALYWLVPKSYIYLNNFCLANLTLAVFNLIPVYPLDGGKIVYAMFKNKKHYKVFNSIFKYVFASMFVCLFICSTFESINYFYLIMAVFFLLLKDNLNPTLSIFKFNKKRKIEKIVLLKISSSETLLELVKKLRNHHYTIFYCHNSINSYLDEDMLIDLTKKYKLTQTLGEIFY